MSELSDAERFAKRLEADLKQQRKLLKAELKRKPPDPAMVQVHNMVIRDYESEINEAWKVVAGIKARNR